jgi:hypothetical protein
VLQLGLVLAFGRSLNTHRFQSLLVVRWRLPWQFSWLAVTCFIAGLRVAISAGLAYRSFALFVYLNSKGMLGGAYLFPWSRFLCLFGSHVSLAAHQQAPESENNGVMQSTRNNPLGKRDESESAGHA